MNCILYVSAIGQTQGRDSRKKVIVEIERDTTTNLFLETTKTTSQVLSIRLEKLNKKKIDYKVFNEKDILLAKTKVILLRRELIIKLKKVRIIKLENNIGYSIYKLRKFQKMGIKKIYDKDGKHISSEKIKHEEITDVLVSEYDFTR